MAYDGYIHQLEGEIAYESKVGYASLTNRVKKHFGAVLMNCHYQWHFHGMTLEQHYQLFTKRIKLPSREFQYLSNQHTRRRFKEDSWLMNK